jgi:hypothetical protein
MSIFQTIISISPLAAAYFQAPPSAGLFIILSIFKIIGVLKGEVLGRAGISHNVFLTAGIVLLVSGHY